MLKFEKNGKVVMEMKDNGDVIVHEAVSVKGSKKEEEGEQNEPGDKE